MVAALPSCGSNGFLLLFTDSARGEAVVFESVWAQCVGTDDVGIIAAQTIRTFHSRSAGVQRVGASRFQRVEDHSARATDAGALGSTASAQDLGRISLAEFFRSKCRSDRLVGSEQFTV